MSHRLSFTALALPACTALLGACATTSSTPASSTSSSAAATVSSAAAGPIAVRDGFVAPEAVRYDPEQDVYFVASWGQGNPGATDNNGFISRMRPDGSIENLMFIAGGTGGVNLHAPRGMTIKGDTLWMADADAVRGFHRRTGAVLATVDFTSLNPGFLNDVAYDGSGALYVTDTGRNRVYRVTGGPTVAVADSQLIRPNGITWEAANNRFIIVPHSTSRSIRAWTVGTPSSADISTSTGGRYDGVEVLSRGRLLVASQADSSLHLFEGATGRSIIKTSGAPADIGVDTRRNRVAVPYVALNRVEIFQLPQ